jgi:hypothetical protein
LGERVVAERVDKPLQKQERRAAAAVVAPQPRAIVIRV